MAQSGPEASVQLLPDAEPWRHTGGDVGVLLCHGFTGTPGSMRPWAHRLADAGYSVSLPLLPGHGTRWQDLNRTRWTDWYGELERAFDELAAGCRLVFCAGLSMGGTLTLRLAQQRGSAVAGLMLVNPALRVDSPFAPLLPFVSRIKPAVKGIGGDVKKATDHEASYTHTPLRAAASLHAFTKLVRADIAEITQPLLIFRSAVDHVVAPANSRLLLARIHSADVTDRVLADSYHVATLDNDAELIFAESLSWLAAHAEASMGLPPDIVDLPSATP
jgi:carboxylesterase